MKKNGFTLTEMVVIVALLAILAVVLVPKLMDNVAKARDSKALSLLGAMRGVTESYYADTGLTPYGGVPVGENNFNASNSLDEPGLDILIKELNKESKEMFSGGYTVGVGGVKTSEDGDLKYGGSIGFTFHAPAGETPNGIELWFIERVIDTENGRYDTKGKAWIEY